MLKLLAALYKLRRTHEHKCIKELCDIVESSRILRYLRHLATGK